MRGLGDWIVERRQKYGMTQRELAERIGTSPAYLSQIERGGTKLPGADLRRGIAKAFNVSHVDVLIAAGELSADELDPGIPIAPDDGPGAEIHALVDRITWRADRVAHVRGLLSAMLD